MAESYTQWAGKFFGHALPGPLSPSPLTGADLQRFPCVPDYRNAMLTVSGDTPEQCRSGRCGVLEGRTGQVRARSGVIDLHSQRRHRGRARKDLSKLCKIFPDSPRLGIRAIFRKVLSNNNLQIWRRVGNGLCLFQCAKDGVSSVLAGQGKRRGRATQRLRPHFPDILTGPVSSVKPHAGKGNQPTAHSHIAASVPRARGARFLHRVRPGTHE